MPVPLNRKQSYDCLIINLLIRQHMQNLQNVFLRVSAISKFAGQRNATQDNIKTIVSDLKRNRTGT